MSRIGINYSDIEQCAQEIAASGQEPTIERIRVKLKTGSNTTIGTHLRAWKAKQDPNYRLLIETQMPEELISLMKGLWERVIYQADTQVTTIKQEVEQEITQLKKALQDLSQDNNRWQQQHLQIKQERDGLAIEKTALEQLIAENRIEKAAAQAKFDGLMQQLQEKQMRLDESHRQNQQAQANLEHYRTASLEQRQQEQQRYEQQQRHLEETIYSLKNEAAELRQQKINLQKYNEQLHFEKISLEAALNKITEHDEKTSAKLIEVNQSLAQQTSAQQHWQVQYENIHAKWEEQTQSNIELKTQLAALSQQLTTTKSELSEISAQNKVLAQEKWTLGQEKAQLIGQFKQLEATL